MGENGSQESKSNEVCRMGILWEKGMKKEEVCLSLSFQSVVSSLVFQNCLVSCRIKGHKKRAQMIVLSSAP